LNTTDWRAVSSHPHELGEGLRVFNGIVHWVDLLRGELYAWNPETDRVAALTHRLDRPLGVVESDAAGRLISAAGVGIAELSEDGTARVLADTPLNSARHRVNDGGFAPDGSFWFGTMVHDGSTPEGCVWRWDPESGDITRLLAGIDIPNGPTFLPDGQTVLVADSAGNRILSTQLNDPGDIALFAEVHGGSPDGMHVDPAGRIWNAVWGASRLDVYAAEGTHLASIPVPVSQPTSVVLTGGRNPLVLLTSATIGLDGPGPLDGHTLAAPMSQVFF
jgi:sugar lactone lactonase